MTQDVDQLVRSLRTGGGDTTEVEVKSAAGGLPESLTSTLSALANLPGGGTIILGLDERAGFLPVHLPDPQALMQGLAAKARSYLPPVQLTLDRAEVDGRTVVVARVHECDPSAKPCRVAASGAAYLRGYDGDFELSDLEIQGFLAARRPPHFDRAPVSDATRQDLDPDLVASYLASVRERDPRGLGRFADDDELLRRAGAVLPDGRPSIAGLLTLGVHPQEFFPRFVIQASAEPRPDDPPGARARNQATITGAIPRMLDEALVWARRTLATTIVTRPDGSVVDEPEYPLVAFRELVANALVHRDLDHWSAGLAVEIRLRTDRLAISNPGGLYGLTVDRLGKDAVTSARNARLVALCQHARTPDTGSRVIEALASGIPAVNTALADRGLPAARFIDAGIRFTALLHRARPDQGQGPRLTRTQRRIYDALASGPATVHHLGTHLDLTAPTLRKALRALVDHDLVVQHGGKGRPTTYHRTDTDRRNTSPAAVRRSAEIFCPIPPRLHVPPATILPVDDETGHAANQLTARGEEHHVPIAARPSFEEVAAVAAAFCQEHLTEEYADLSIKLAAKLARKRPSPLLRGDRRIWAAAVVCALGRLNFLADPSQTPHLPVARLATLFGVKQTTMSTKAKSVLDLLGLDHFDTEFCLPSRLISHPTAWLVLIDGLVHDARTLPVELQIALARRGVIPGVVVPADAEAPAGTEAGR